MKCPLCENTSIKKLDIVKKDNLIFLYKNSMNTDITNLVDTDIDFCECENCKLRFYNPIITGNESFYNSLQKFEWYYLDDKEEYSYSKKYISNSDKVLEIGSGKGAFAKYINRTNYIGLDFSRNAKKLAEQNGIVIENDTIQNYAENNQAKFDVVVSFQVLEHVSNPKEFLEAKLKALKIGGKLIIAVPSEDSFLKYATNSILNMPPHHVTRWSDETFVYIANKYKLDIIDIYHERVQPIHYLWYLNTIISNMFIKNKIIDMSIIYKLVSKISSILARFFLNKLNREMLPNGMTVIATFKKV